MHERYYNDYVKYQREAECFIINCEPYRPIISLSHLFFKHGLICAKMEVIFFNVNRKLFNSSFKKFFCYSFFMMLTYFLLYGKVNQSYIYPCFF